MLSYGAFVVVVVVNIVDVVLFHLLVSLKII